MAFDRLLVEALPCALHERAGNPGVSGQDLLRSIEFPDARQYAEEDVVDEQRVNVNVGVVSAVQMEMKEKRFDAERENIGQVFDTIRNGILGMSEDFDERRQAKREEHGDVLRVHFHECPCLALQCVVVGMLETRDRFAEDTHADADQFDVGFEWNPPE